jgi:DNA-directed RNA polymerase subunit M/transcription elongation factor TFIIS
MEFCKDDNGLMIHVTDGATLQLECRLCHKRQPTNTNVVDSHAYDDKYIPEKQNQEDRIMMIATQLPIFRRVYRKCEDCGSPTMTLYQREENLRTDYVCACGNCVTAAPGDELPTDW